MDEYAAEICYDAKARRHYVQFRNLDSGEVEFTGPKRATVRAAKRATLRVLQRVATKTALTNAMLIAALLASTSGSRRRREAS